MKKRIIGINVARALAVFGMVIVNFKMVFGAQGDGWLLSVSNFFSGKAAATFVVLAGIGLALMTNSSFKNNDQQKLQTDRKKILRKAIFLFVVGLSYIWIWPADILHYYGIYMLIALLFINRPPRQILNGAIGLIILYSIMMIFINYDTGWDFSVLTYTDFWTVGGFFRNLFYNGFHPVIPWAAFMLFGLWYGRQDLYDSSFLKKSLKISSVVFIIVQLFSFGILQFLTQENADGLQSLTPLFGTEPMPPLPIYMVSGISISIVAISACILLSRLYENSKIIGTLNKTGQLALTFYVAHVILGMGILEEVGSLEFGEYSIGFSVLYALAFSLSCILFAEIWLRFFKSGPLEWIMRKLTD